CRGAARPARGAVHAAPRHADAIPRFGPVRTNLGLSQLYLRHGAVPVFGMREAWAAGERKKVNEVIPD
ncbi:hypothetical protein, partial [Amycolatopsis sp. NPDC054798]